MFSLQSFVRHTVPGLVVASVRVAAGATSAAAQGACIRAYGTPRCNTDSIPAERWTMMT